MPGEAPAAAAFARPVSMGGDPSGGMRQAMEPVISLLREFLGELRRGQGVGQGGSSKQLPHQPTAAPISTAAVLPPPNPGGMSEGDASREALLNAAGRLLGNVLPLAMSAGS